MMNYTLLPSGLRGGVQQWIEEGIQPGGFLSAVIENDLRESLGRAYETNRARIFEIVSFFYNEAPSPCWGSVKNARAWADKFERDWE